MIYKKKKNKNIERKKSLKLPSQNLNLLTINISLEISGYLIYAIRWKNFPVLFLYSGVDIGNVSGSDRRKIRDTALFTVRGDSSFLMERGERRNRAPMRGFNYSRLGERSWIYQSVRYSRIVLEKALARISRNCEATTKLRNEDENVVVVYWLNDPMPASVPVISVSISRLCVSGTAPRDAQRCCGSKSKNKSNKKNCSEC